MGKANKAKHNKQRFNNVTYYWDDLLEEKNKLISFYTESVAKFDSLIKINQEVINKDLTLKTKVNGLMFSFLDLSKKIRFAMERHIEYEFMISKENTLEYFLDPDHNNEYETLLRSNPGTIKEVKHLTGKVNTKKENDVYLYMGIQSDYVNIGMELAGMLGMPLASILSDLGIVNEDLKEFKKIEDDAVTELNEFYNKNLQEMKNKEKENTDGKQE